MTVSMGLDVLVHENFARLDGLKVGLLAHPASVDREFRHAALLMKAAAVDLQVLYGPEHGVLGTAQDMEVVAEDATDPYTGARVFGLYGATVDTLKPTVKMLDGVDVVVVDMQDVGARYYTFAATMVYMMETAAKAGVRVMVLDRPNPLGGRDEDIEGPPVHADYRSFVGAYDLPMRHGLTMGEYAVLMRSELGIDCELEVVKMEGWKRSMDYEATGGPWVLPSPNMPTVDSAWIYPGMCIIEGTAMSEGRGTTRPFELVGAPYLDPLEWAKAVGPQPGIVLRPAFFTPMFQKQARLRCGALSIHVTDRWKVRSTRLATRLIETARNLAPNDFAWRTETYEYVDDRLAIDLLYGSDAVRVALEGGATTEDIAATWVDHERSFCDRRRPALLYP